MKIKIKPPLARRGGLTPKRAGAAFIDVPSSSNLRYAPRDNRRFHARSLSRLCARGSASGRHQSSEAAAEFQKIIDHPGVVANEPIGALAHIGLARAYSMQGDTAKSRAAYQDFLTVWKDADPDIPVLREAKAEYAKLR